MSQTTETINKFDELTATYALCHEELVGILQDMEQELQAVKRNYLAQIKASAAGLATAKSVLENSLLDHPDMFVKPRSYVLHGVKFGYKSSAGKLESGKNTVELVKKHFPGRLEELVETEEKPVTKAIRDLTPGERRLLGCKLVGAGDKPFVKNTADDIEKLVAKMLEDAAANTTEGK